MSPDTVDPAISGTQHALPPALKGYKALERRAAGAFADIVLAVDPTSGRKVAIKQPHPAETSGGPAAAEAVRSIQREGDVLRRLTHPGVVRLIDQGEWNGTPYLVLAAIDGDDLEHRFPAARGPMPSDRLAGLLGALCDALDYIHRQGFLHRDLKPANVFLASDGRPVVVDFGAAAMIGEAADSRGGFSLATPGYAAPEQYRASGGEGPWTDVYGLSALAYRLVAGRPPPPAPDRLGGEKMRSAVELGASRYPSALVRAIDAGLNLETGLRPRSVAAWREMAGLSATAPSGAHDASDTYPPTEVIERRDEPDRMPPRGREVAGAQDVAGGAGRGRRWLWGLVAPIVLIAAAIWPGWLAYERYIKREWTVDASGAGDAASIGEALARAREDATIYLAPATYRETIFIGRPVHIRPADGASDAPVIAPADGACVVATAARASVVGLIFQPSQSGDACIQVRGGKLVFQGNEIVDGSAAALFVHDGADPLIAGNRFTASGGPAIVLGTGARGTIRNNVIADTGMVSIVVRGGAAPTLADNRIEKSGAAGIVFAEGARGEFADNVIVESRASAIEVRSGADPLIRANRIEDAGEAGIYVYEAGLGTISDNRILRSGFSGIVISSAAEPTIVDNLIGESREHGIAALAGSGGKSTKNTVEANAGIGIYVAPGSRMRLDGNVVKANELGDVLDAGEAAAGPR